MMVQNLTVNDLGGFGEPLDFVGGGAARQDDRRAAANVKTAAVSAVFSGRSPAGRSIATGRDLLRSPFPLGWSNR
jgi:hypothetical protein